MKYGFTYEITTNCNYYCDYCDIANKEEYASINTVNNVIKFLTYIYNNMSDNDTIIVAADIDMHTLSRGNHHFLRKELLSRGVVISGVSIDSGEVMITDDLAKSIYKELNNEFI